MEDTVEESYTTIVQLHSYVLQYTMIVSTSVAY